MPDYKKQIKQVIYSDTLEEEQKIFFNSMMALLGDKNPEEYIKNIDIKLAEASGLQEKRSLRYEDSLKEIENEYKNGIREYADMARSKSNDLGSPANLMHLYLESMDSLEDLWEDRFGGKENNISDGGLKKVWEDIQKEIATASVNRFYSSTEVYKSLSLEEKNVVDRYSSFATEIDKYRSDSDPEIKDKLAAVEENIKEYNFYKDQYKERKKESLDSNPEKEKLGTISALISSLNKKKEDMQSFMEGHYKNMQEIKAGGISDSSKENALDMLTQARAEYRNKCNLWQRIWANILPSSLYAPAEYVEKINAYKETLQETGFAENEIENADPEKSGNYLYDKNTKQYIKQERLSADLLKDTDRPIKAAEEEVQVKGRQQSKEFVSDLAEITGENKEAEIQKKAENAPANLINDAPKFGGKGN